MANQARTAKATTTTTEQSRKSRLAGKHSEAERYAEKEVEQLFARHTLAS